MESVSGVPRTPQSTAHPGHVAGLGHKYRTSTTSIRGGKNAWCSAASQQSASLRASDLAARHFLAWCSATLLEPSRSCNYRWGDVAYDCSATAKRRRSSSAPNLLAEHDLWHVPHAARPMHGRAIRRLCYRSGIQLARTRPIVRGRRRPRGRQD